MNKTEIIKFIIDEAVFKLWQLSSNMRKRVKMVVKGMNISVKKYNEKVILLSDWVEIKGLKNKPRKGEDYIKRGVYTAQ